jgi:hypothetical protein
MLIMGPAMNGKFKRVMDMATSDTAEKAIKLQWSKRESWQSDLLRGAFLAAQALKKRGSGNRNTGGGRIS